MARREAQQVVTAPRSYEEIQAIYIANAADPTKATFEGLTTEEIVLWNRRMMPGYLGD